MLKKDIKHKTLKNSFWAISSSLTNRFGALLFTILIARFLMPENFGLYSIVISFVMILHTFADLGVNNTLVRYISASLTKHKNKIFHYYKYLLRIKFSLTLLMFLLLVLMAYPLSFIIYKNKNLFYLFLIGAVYLFVLSIEGFYVSIFYSLENIKYINLKEFLTQILRIFLSLLIFYFLKSSYYVGGILLSLILIHLFIFLLTFFYLKRVMPLIFIKTKTKINKKEIRTFVKYLTLASLSGVFFSYIDSIMLSFFLPMSYVGYYRASFSLILGITGIFALPSLLLLPLFSKITKKDSKRVLKLFFRYLSLFCIPISFGIALLGKYFIIFFYGKSYLPSTFPLFFLSFLILPVIGILPILHFFSANKKPDISAKLIIITSFVNIILNFIFIKGFLLISPLWATSGAAIATLVSWIFYLLLAFYSLKKYFKISISLSFLIKPLIGGMFMGLFVYLIANTIFKTNLFYLILTILFGSLFYLLILIILKGVNRQDLNFLRLLLDRKWKKQKN